MSVAAISHVPARLLPRSVPADALLHPLALAALVLLILNDHFLKDLAPGPLTGKLSDVAGLVVLPLIILGAWELAMASRGRWFGPSRPALIGAIAIAGAAFAAIKLSGDGAEIYRVGMGLARWPIDAFFATGGGAPPPVVGRVLLVQDVSDMICLPALLLAWHVGHRRLGT